MLALSLTSCASNYIPAPKVLKQIKNIPYKEPNMVCWHKSLAYHNYLKFSGIESRVVVGYCYENKIGTNHAWVEVKKDGEWYVIDPTDTNFDDGYKAKYYDMILKGKRQRTKRRIVRE